MSSPTTIPVFADAMPAFLDDAHRALSRKLAGDLEGIHIDDHDAARLVERLVRADAFALVVDPQVRALCVAREALGYVSPMADSIFAV